jgi:hypothetical protein
MSRLDQPRALGPVQRWFFDAVTRPDDVMDGELERAVVGGMLPARARLDIYRHGYVTRLVECLADDYPAVAHALGASAFEATCREFIAHNPPTSSSLSYYGARFAERCGALSGRPDADFVTDLARLEWALVEVIHADAGASLDATELGGIAADDWPRLRLVPSPALRLLRCNYPVHRFYQAFVEGAAPGVLERTPSGVAVCRQADDVWRFGLDPAGLELLGQLCAGSPLSSALAAFEAIAREQDAAALQRSLSEWVAAGFFAGIALD